MQAAEALAERLQFGFAERRLDSREYLALFKADVVVEGPGECRDTFFRHGAGFERCLELLDSAADLGVLPQHPQHPGILIGPRMRNVGRQQDFFLFPKVLLASLFPEAKERLRRLLHRRDAPDRRCLRCPAHQQRLGQSEVVMLAESMQAGMAFHLRVVAGWLLPGAILENPLFC